MKQGLFKKFLIGFFIANILCLLGAMFTANIAVSDEFEHIHVSWLIWDGHVPYRDFLEHHHPLMWYLFAPLIGLFEGNILIFYGVRLIMAACSLFMLYLVYKIIKNYLADDIAAWIAINIFCFSALVLNTMVHFKPDTLMHLFFWLGTYYFFTFIQDKKQKQLNLCALFYTIAFLFLQTAAFLILPIALVCIYLLCTKELSLKSCALAAIMPVFIIAGCVIFMYFNGSLQRYYELNWVVNSHIADYLSPESHTLEKNATEIASRRINDYSDYYGTLIIGLCCALYLLFRKKDKYTRIFLLMYLTELMLRTLYLSPYVYYFKTLLLYNAVLMGIVAADIYKLRSYAAYFMLLLFIPCLLKIYPFQKDMEKMLLDTTGSTQEITITSILSVITDITKNSSRDDMVLGITVIPFGVFNQNPHYYWFSWDYIGYIDEMLYHYTPPFDMQKIITEVQPKFIYFENDLLPNYKPKSRFDIDPVLLNKYYRKAIYNTLYLRKDD